MYRAVELETAGGRLAERFRLRLGTVIQVVGHLLHPGIAVVARVNIDPVGCIQGDVQPLDDNLAEVFVGRIN